MEDASSSWDVCIICSHALLCVQMQFSPTRNQRVAILCRENPPLEWIL